METSAAAASLALVIWTIVALYTGNDPSAGADLGGLGFVGEAAETYPTKAACEEALKAWQSSDNTTYICAEVVGRQSRL
jgi:hypothetical protein